MIIVSRIMHVKVDRRLNVTNKLKYQRRLSSRLAIVMFRGTPCIYIVSTAVVILSSTLHVHKCKLNINYFNIIQFTVESIKLWNRKTTG